MMCRGAVFSVALGLVLIAGSGLGVARGEDGVSVIREGQLKGVRWSVEALPERRGICLEAALTRPRHSDDGVGRGQCSSPAPRRGIVLAVADPHSKRSLSGVTVVGAAFAPAVRKVLIRRFDGSLAQPKLLRAGSLAPALVRRFRYLTLAVPGTWCAKSLSTFDGHGHLLWRTRWQEFDSGWRSDPASSPRATCPGAKGR